MHDSNFVKPDFFTCTLPKTRTDFSERAVAQKREFLTQLRQAGANVHDLPIAPGAHGADLFQNHAVLFSSHAAFLGQPAPSEAGGTSRRPLNFFTQNGFRVHAARRGSLLGGDVQLLGPGLGAIVGCGQKTTLSGAYELGQFLEEIITPLELRDPILNRLNKALNLVRIKNGLVVFACADAFPPRAWELIHLHSLVREVVQVPRTEALAFALNWVEVCGTVVLGTPAPRVEMALRALGRDVVISPLTEFCIRGESATTLVAPVHEGYAEVFTDPSENWNLKKATEGSSVEWI